MAKGKVNVKLLKKNLTLPMHRLVLKAIDIPIFSESDREWRCYSGDKYKNALEGKVKLYFYPDSGLYVGYNSARTYDLIGLVQQRLKVLGKNCSFMDAINLILSVTGLDPDAVQRINTNPNVYNWEEKLEKYLRVKRGESALPAYDPTILEQLSKRIPQEWLDEGISEETMEKYQIRYYDHDCSTVIPAFSREGELVGARVREWNPDRIESWGKYHPLTTLCGEVYKFPTNIFLFGVNYTGNEIERTGTVLIGESEKFVMKLDTWFKEKSCAVGMLGNNLGSVRRNQLVKMGVSKVIYVPDNDWIGKEQEKYNQWEQDIENFGKLWKGYASVEIVYDNQGLLNPKENATDKSYEVWEKLYNNRESL